MAVAYQHNINTPQEIIWRKEESSECEDLFYVDHFDKHRTGGSLRLLISNKKFITYFISFKAQFKKLQQHFGEIDINEAKLKFANSLSSILFLNPDLLSMELMYDKSIFYTIRKGTYTIFLQHNIDVNDEDDEAILSIFQNDKKLPSYAGPLKSVMNEFSNIIAQSIEYKFETPIHTNELSY